MNWCLKRQSVCLWSRIQLETAVRPAVSNPTWHRVTWHIQVVYPRFLLDPSEILAPHTCKCSDWRFRKAIYVFTVTKSTWNCLSPGRFKPHVWVSHWTYVGRIPHLRFLLDPSEILAPHTCERHELMFKKAIYVFVITNSTWNCRSPGRFKSHVTSSHLTYSGRVPPISPRSEWNLGTTYLQVQLFEVLKRQSMCLQ